MQAHENRLMRGPLSEALAQLAHFACHYAEGDRSVASALMTLLLVNNAFNKGVVLQKFNANLAGDALMLDRKDIPYEQRLVMARVLVAEYYERDIEQGVLMPANSLSSEEAQWRVYRRGSMIQHPAPIIASTAKEAESVARFNRPKHLQAEAEFLVLPYNRRQPMGRFYFHSTSMAGTPIIEAPTPEEAVVIGRWVFLIPESIGSSVSRVKE